MNKLLVILGLVSMSSAIFSAECTSLDLAKEQDRISAIQGISIERQALHLDFLKNAKVTQVLSCVGLGESISKEDAIFTINDLVASRNSVLRALGEQQAFLKSALQATNLSESRRSLYNETLSLISQQIIAVNNSEDSLIVKIKQLANL